MKAATCPECRREWPLTPAGYFVTHSTVGLGLICRGANRPASDQGEDMKKKRPGDRTRGGIVPQPGATCDSCGRPADIACSCRCGAAACRQCIKEGRVG